MRIFLLFILAGILLWTPDAIIAQSLVPIQSYDNGVMPASSAMRTLSTTIVQDDTLKLPYIEDFSGPQMPVTRIDTVSDAGFDKVCKISNMKLHGLTSGDAIFIFYVRYGAPTEIDSALITGIKYVKVLSGAPEKYSFLLFEDAGLTAPTPLPADKRLPFALRWKRNKYIAYNTNPDTLGFKYYGSGGGGVSINNFMGLNVPSTGVATFDGIDQDGKPYVKSTGNVTGYTRDSLVSLPFNLSKFTPDSNVYMSFYWQKQGLGISPYPSDTIKLEFKDNTGIWNPVWFASGEDYYLNDVFYDTILPIKDVKYLYKGFQYRFRSTGLVTGQYDIWNIDYIFINSQRDPTQPFTNDLTISGSTPGYFKYYRAIPYVHFKRLQPEQRTEQVATDPELTVRYLNFTTETIVAPDEARIVLTNNLGTVLETDSIGPSITTNPYTITGLQTTEKADTDDALYVYTQEYSLSNYDALNNGSIDFGFNNFTRVDTYLRDFYAYDDGTAEMAYETYAIGTKMSLKYKVLVQDTMTHIDICFMRNKGSDLAGSTVYLKIWNAQLNELFSQQIKVQYSPDINGFVRYPLQYPVIIPATDSIYIGYQQNFKNNLYVGFDRNNNFISKMYYSLKSTDTKWTPMSQISTVGGALMVRPVFFKSYLPTSIDEPVSLQRQFQIYPNPNSGKLFFLGAPEHFTLYDLSGKVIMQQVLSDEEGIQLPDVSDGLYIIHVFKDTYSEIHKLMIQRN